MVSPWRQQVILLGVSLLTWLAALPIARPWQSADHWAALGFGAGLCIVGASVALALQSIWQKPDDALKALGLGMLVRMGLPLGGGLVLSTVWPSLVEAGFLYSLVAFYLVTLAAETLLVVGRVNALAPSTRGASVSGVPVQRIPSRGEF